MKKAIIYGEFLDNSSTGIAYMNSLLEKALKRLDFDVKVICEPRAKDLENIKVKVKKKLHLYDFFRVFIDMVFIGRKDIAFITISQSNIGLFKTLLISFLLKINSRYLYLYVHRGDLHLNLKNSTYRKISIKLLFLLSHKIIFLSKTLSKKFKKCSFRKKFIIIPNALNKKDIEISKTLFDLNFKQNFSKNRKNFKVIFCGNIQSQKGINEISYAINKINKRIGENKIVLDVYGIPFEKLNEVKNQIQYKGILSYKDRLKVMSKYDFLIIASRSEGMPMIIIECLALGLPFITTEVGAISDLLIKNYPYICSFNRKSIIEIMDKIIYDFENEDEKLKKIIFLNNKLFLESFRYKNYLDNIRTKIKS